MADTPTPRSYPQTLGDMFDAFLANQGIRSLRVGGPIVSLLEAAAQSDMRGSQDTFNLLTSADLDNATGLALARIGRSEKVPKLEIAPASGKIDITDSSFSKISTKLFQGAAAPIVGSLTISVVDASLFPSSGDIYIGRGTNNYEGKLTYSSKTNIGNHWELTLASGTTKFHNTSETVILAQGGNRVVGEGTIVRTPQADVANAIEFRTLFPATMPDGEVDLKNVDVVAQQSGQIGNVIADAIKEFSSPPFTGAVVTNPNPFVNGRETESDDDYRERIRAVRASRQLGTTLAIQTAITGITAFDENKRINSAALVKRFGFPATLYIDDGTGYEERTAAIAVESLMDDAVGGETHFETTQRPIARAFAVTKNSAPYVLRNTDQLSVKVGGVLYTHAFNAEQFHTMSSASAFEVVAAINSNPDIAFSARTAESGSKVIVFANSDVDEDVEVVTAVDGTDANDALQFPAGINYTMRLYKNDRLLVKDGKSASIQSLSFAQWDTVSGSQTLGLAIDHTDSISFTFTDQDFIDAGTGYATVGRNSLAAWAAVINAGVPGITATVNSGKLVLTSNAGPVEKAGVEVTGGTLVSAHFFALVSDEGRERDYTLDRNEAQVVLSRILESGDRLTAGSLFTRSFVESDDLTATDILTDAKLWWIVDGSADVLNHGITPVTSLNVTIQKTLDWGNVMQLDAGTAVPFENIEADDWCIIWDDAAPATLQGVHRVLDVSVDNKKLYLERHTNLTMRSGHRSVLIPGSGTTIGKVLTCGGAYGPRTSMAPSTVASGVLKTAELYNHNTKITTPAAPMSVPRMYHTATVLANGKVVVVGGLSITSYLTSIETYDPVADTWTLSARNLTTARKNHTATLLTDGRILIAGGDAGGGGLNTYQIYDPTADTITAPATMVKNRSRHCAVKLTDDTVLIAGGFDGASLDLADCERFTPGPDTTAATGSMNVARSGFGMEMVGVAPTKVIAVGNHFLATGNNNYETYSIAGATWTGPTTTGNLRWEDKPITRIANGHVVGVDGYNSADATEQRGFTYDGTTFTNTTTQPLTATDLGGPRWDSEYVELKSGDGTTVKNIIASIGGNWDLSSDWDFPSTAVLTTYNEPLDQWDSPDPGTINPLVLSDIGIAFVRSNGRVQETTIAAAANYTPTSIVSALNDSLNGATASVYKTTKFRVRTNTFAVEGDIALVTENVGAEPLLLDAGDVIENLTSHLGSVQSGGSELGTPSFEDGAVVSQEAGTPHSKPVVTSTFIDSDYTMVGLRNWWRGDAVGSSSFAPNAYTNKRANSNYQFRTRIASFLNAGPASTVETRIAPNQPWGPWDRVYFSAPYAISPNDTLEVVVDNTNDKRYSINMWRALTTVGNVYATSNDFKDSDAGGVSLAETFGLEYDFNEFAVFMPARAVAFIGDANRKHIFRYFRLGPDGNGVQLRYGNPDAPSTDLQVDTVQTSNGFTDVTIKLRSGAARAVTVHNSTRVGTATTNITAGGTATILEVLNLTISSAVRAANVDTLTLTLPATITDHGLQVGNNIWVESTDVNFSSGLKTITARTATTIDYSEVAANAGPTANIGTVSFDSQGEATYSGSSVAVNDFFRQNGTVELFVIRNVTLQVASVPAGGHHITVLSGDQLDGGSLSTSTTLSWIELEVSSNLQVFDDNPQTVTQIVAAINALRAADSSTCPIKASVIGTGTGTIVQNSCDLNDNSQFWYILTDGVNWIKTTGLPINIADDYTLTFKDPITGTLAADADWVNEEVRIAPITTPTIVEWFNTPTVTGLWTVADIEASDDGTRVQISTLTPGSAGGVQIQGGTANNANIPVVGSPQLLFGRSSSTIGLLDGTGISKGMWCRIENGNPLPKHLVLATGTVLNSWTTDGLLTFATPIVSESVSPVQLQMQFEKQGRFVAISDIGARTNVNLAGISNGDWVRISAPSFATPNLPSVSAANEGIFRVLRSAPSGVGNNGGTIYIENPSVIEEFVECDITVYSADSVMPGDQLVVLTDTWGAQNVGVWTINSVGTTTATSNDPFATDDRFVVDVSQRTPFPQGVCDPIPGFGLIFAQEGTPCVYIMKVIGITLNQDDGDFLDIRWDKGISAASISAAAGSIVQVLDKLDFSLDFASGADGYRYDVGLLREANKVVYGDPSDPLTYPGVAAADSHINIQGPLIKRIQVSVSIRIKSGLNTQDIANRVRSAIASVVNKTPIGQSISFSDIVEAARAVTGVVSVTVVAPLYSVGHDQIKVQPYEKPYVLDLTQDVQVSFVGT